MLIYNYKKEFIGIDEKDLKTLGLETFAQLRAEANDFADLFVKTPGYVHNFQHVHWIDYIACADSSEQPRVVINANNHLFKADVSIATAYLADNPIEKAYLIHLNHLRKLSDSETSTISTDFSSKPAQQTAVSQEPISFTSEFETPEITKAETIHNILEDEYDTETAPYETPLAVDESPLDVGDLSVENVVDESFNLYPETTAETAIEPEYPTPLEIPESIEVAEAVVSPEPVKKPAVKAATIHLDEELDKVLNSGYIYNPQIASDELGLPLDLIEEFIGDFISQAKEFKTDLYSALEEGDIDSVKILSHKLKGVAANLRIEDALEVLTTINTTSDFTIIKRNLTAFYIIIAKLAGEEINIDNGSNGEEHEEAHEEELMLDFKDEPEETLSIDNEDFTKEFEVSDEDESELITIADHDVPEQIDIPELADDVFVAQDELSIDFADEAESSDEALLLDESLSLEDENIQLELPETTKFSKEQIANEIGLDAASLHELLEDFNAEADEIIGTMKTAVNNSDLDLVKSQANKLKGMSNNIRFTELSTAAQNLLAVDNVESVSNMITQLEKLLEQIKD